MTVWSIWTNPRYLKTCVPDDLPKALAWFREQTGLEPHAVQLDPTLSAVAAVVPEGIAITFCHGLSPCRIGVAERLPGVEGKE